MKERIVSLTALAESDDSCLELTLLDLVRAISAITRDDGEIVATIGYMLANGRVRLKGEFRERELDCAHPERS